MEIPLDSLNPDTLRRIVEEFVTRDGTELSEQSVKVEQVLRQLVAGKAQVRWDPVLETTNIVPLP